MEKELSRRGFLKNSALLATAAATGVNATDTASAKTPKITGGTETKYKLPKTFKANQDNYNILFILTDQEHYMGSTWPFPLPSRERLRNSGTFFENHQIAANMCSSSRAVIYTGQHMPHNGIFDNAGVPYMKSLSPSIPTVGKMLRKIGYYPAYKGKFHLNNLMAKVNKPNDTQMLFENLMDKDYGFYDYTGEGDFIDGALGGYHYDEVVTAKSIQWLKRIGQPLNDKKQPWYLAVNLVNPHDVMWVNTDIPGKPNQSKEAMLPIVYVPNDRNYHATWNGIPLQATRKQPLNSPERPAAHEIYWHANGILTGIVPNDERAMRLRQNFYFNSIRETDRQIGLLLSALDDLDMSKKTIIIFTADHGELLGSHGGLTSKGTTIYKQQNHVPLIMVHPEYKGGQQCRAVTSHVDLLPTILSMTKQDTKPIQEEMSYLPGYDLTTLLHDPKGRHFPRNKEGALFCYSMLQVHDRYFTKDMYKVLEDKSISARQEYKKIEDFPIDWPLRVAIRSITTDEYKFGRYFSFKQFNTPRTEKELLALNDLELYDLENDPEETHNLAYDFQKNRSIVLEMNTKLNALIHNEIGVDDGSFLPLTHWVNWKSTQKLDVRL